MIKPVISSPMVRKFAVGAMMVGAAAGMSSCSSKVDDVSYEYNERLLQRITDTYKPGWFSKEAVISDTKDFMSTYGLYAGTIISQRRLDQRTISHSDFFRKMSDMEKIPVDNLEALGVLRVMKDYMDMAESSDKTFLMRDGANLTPTPEECIQYLDETYAGMVNGDLQKVARYCRESNDFKESLGRMNNQKMAELIAFKQFKIDSVGLRLCFKNYPKFFENNELKTMYERTYFPKIAKPTVEPSYWNKFVNWVKNIF